MPDPDDTRQKLLAAAFELFTSNSYRKVSVSAVAERAGVSKGGLFHYYPSKYALATEALFRHIEAGMSGYLENAAGTEPRDRIRGLIDVSFDTIVADSSAIRLFLDLYEEGLDDGEDMNMWKDFFHRYHSYLTTAISETGQNRPEARALILMAALDGLSLYCAFMRGSDGRMDIEAIRKTLVEMYRLD